MIYLDAAATTPIRRQVVEAMWPYLTGEFGNPSSVHSLGAQAARGLVEARERVAAALGCSAGEVTFTSGGTEADNLAVKGMALATPRGRHLVAMAIEHPAVLESCDYLVRHHGFDLSLVDVDSQGSVDTEALSAALRPDTTLVAAMLANNEVGTVQPIADIAVTARAAGARIHSDAVQAAGWLDLNVDLLGVDSLALSGHKLGAPKGIGALYVRRGVRIEPLVHGGGQERGRRSGTENVAGAIGFAVALELAETTRVERGIRLSALRDQLIRGVLDAVPSARVTGHPAKRLPFNASFTFAGTSGEAVLLELERRGIICSSGSACAAGSDEASPVLVAMGIPPEVAQTAVRFTLSDETSTEDIEETIRALGESHAVLGNLAR